MSTDIERRTQTLGTRGLGSASASATISGRAVVYNVTSDDLGGFVERFAPGSVQVGDDLYLLFGHDHLHVLGRASAGTLRAWDDGNGLAFECDPPETQWAKDLRTSMKRGDIKQCSFAFVAEDEAWSVDPSGTPLRTVKRARIHEISIVAMPAYPQSSATHRYRP